MGVFARLSYIGINYLLEDYSFEDNNRNRLYEAGSMHIGIGIGIGIGFCSSNVEYIIAQVGCGLLGSFGASYLGDLLYSNINLRLSEQTWYEYIKQNTRALFGFSVSAGMRLVCEGSVEALPDRFIEGIDEIYTDTLSGFTIDLIDFFKTRVDSDKTIYDYFSNVSINIKNNSDETSS